MLTARWWRLGCVQGSWWGGDWSSPPRWIRSGTWRGRQVRCCIRCSTWCPPCLRKHRWKPILICWRSVNNISSTSLEFCETCDLSGLWTSPSPHTLNHYTSKFIQVFFCLSSSSLWLPAANHLSDPNSVSGNVFPSQGFLLSLVVWNGSSLARAGLCRNYSARNLGTAQSQHFQGSLESWARVSFHSLTWDYRWDCDSNQRGPAGPNKNVPGSTWIFII